jgi:hypothetical protein
MNIRSNYVIWILGLITLCLISCESRKTASVGDGTDSLMIQYQALADSVEANWNIMIADDDDKHVLMKRLLLEVSYTNNYDKSRFEELTSLVNQLQPMRYDQSTMSDSDLIDLYDSATWDLTDQIIQFAREHPRYADYPMMEELIDDINAKNNYVLMHRIHYDAWVKELNSFKESNAQQLLHEDPSIGDDVLPIFELSS